MIRYVVSDVDGTLLPEGKTALDPELFVQIKNLKEKGIRFIAASGRQYANLRRLFEPVRDDISYITENGALCIHEGEVISRGLIGRDLGIRIIKAARNFPDCDCLLSCESRCYTESKNERFLNYMRDIIRYDMDEVPDLTEIQKPFLKIAACDFNGTDEMLGFFKERFAEEIPVATGADYWVDFIAPDADKGIALTALLDHLGLSPADGIAFGDQYNDIELLKSAGIRCAMSCGAPGIERYADYVIDSVIDVLKKITESD